MPFFTALATASAATIISTGAAVAGAATAGYGAVQQQQAQSDASRASREAERIRRQQLELDNRRRMSQIIRETQANRARSIASATARGAQDSSALEGGLSSILSQGGANFLAQGENVALGRQMFDANADFSEARGRAQTAGAIGDFGRSLFANSEAIGRVGSNMLGPRIGTWETRSYRS